MVRKVVRRIPTSYPTALVCLLQCFASFNFIVESFYNMGGWLSVEFDAEEHFWTSALRSQDIFYPNWSHFFGVTPICLEAMDSSAQDACGSCLSPPPPLHDKQL